MNDEIELTDSIDQFVLLMVLAGCTQHEIDAVVGRKKECIVPMQEKLSTQYLH